MKKETAMIHLNESEGAHLGAVVPPIFQNSLFTFNKWEDIDNAFSHPQDNFIYSRGNNPSVELVEDKIAQLCGGEEAKLFGSGMGAISAAILHYVKAGDHIITINNVYGPTNTFINSYLKEKCHITSTFVEGKEVSDFENAIQENTTLIYLESPSSVVFSLQDLESITRLAKEKGIRTVIDNTWATPIFQNPLKLGVDLEVHSCSKYLGGHSDIVSGVIIGSSSDIRQISATEGALLGAKMAPFEAWLLLRSLRTLNIRMKEHMRSTSKIVDFLENHAAVNKVTYPGSKDFDQKDLAKKQMTGFTGLFSIELSTKDIDKIKRFVNSLKYFKIGVSWGGHESLVYVPAISLSKELSVEQFNIMGISFSDIRISIGLEDVDDLITDLQQALDTL